MNFAGSITNPVDLTGQVLHFFDARYINTNEKIEKVEENVKRLKELERKSRHQQITIDDFRMKFRLQEDKIIELEAEITEKIREQETKITAKIKDQETKITAKIRELETKLTDKINQSIRTLDLKVDELNENIDKKITTIKNSIKTMEGTIKTNNDDTISGFNMIARKLTLAETNLNKTGDKINKLQTNVDKNTKNISRKIARLERLHGIREEPIVPPDDPEVVAN